MYFFLRHIIASIRLFDSCFKHDVAYKVHQLHLSLLPIREKARVEISGESGTYLGDVFGTEMTLHCIMEVQVAFLKLWTRTMPSYVVVCI